MVERIKNIDFLNGQLDDSLNGELPLNSQENIKWVCSRENCKGWFCSPFIRYKYPNILGCCRKKYGKCMDCDKKACYNYKEFNWGLYCLSHKEHNMVDVKNPKCEYAGCNKQPRYNNVDEKNGKFCFLHKEPQMVDTTHKTCEYSSCRTRPSYNNIGEKRGRFCLLHKEEAMVNVVDKTCEYKSCMKKPTYNNAGEKGGRFCLNHKEPQMIDVLNRLCSHDQCRKGHISITRMKNLQFFVIYTRNPE